MSAMSTVDLIGFAAAGFVLATFCMGSMRALRWMAIASNVAFIAYGYHGDLAPVLLLHALLLPVNAYRLAQLSLARSAESQRNLSSRAIAALGVVAICAVAGAAGEGAKAHQASPVAWSGNDRDGCTPTAPRRTTERAEPARSVAAVPFICRAGPRAAVQKSLRRRRTPSGLRQARNRASGASGGRRRPE